MPEYSLYPSPPGFHCIASGLQGHERGCVARQQQHGCRDKSMPKYPPFTPPPDSMTFHPGYRVMNVNV
ncbi:hypothetical protein [Celerinatantimonas sp. YJH-8]|uniref:hypothetical protein n=1 Tax=Celerinatantimonas sp. YJH-8 TaxID=3228714 RepID=UPI0038C02A6B